MRKVERLPTRDCEAGYGPVSKGAVARFTTPPNLHILLTSLKLLFLNSKRTQEKIDYSYEIQQYEHWQTFCTTTVVYPGKNSVGLLVHNNVFTGGSRFLRGDYTLLLSNFVLDITFEQIH